jgi:hypothetical protein
MVVGIEIDPQGKRFAGDRIKVEIGSQDDGEFLAEVTRKYFPDVVIDDGSHRPDHQIFSFEHLFPALAPAGCYIVEDVSVARSERYGGISATSYFGRLQEGLMSRWTCGGLDAVPPWVRTEVSRVDVFRGAVAVWKSEAINFSSNVNWLEELVRRSEKPESWLYLSEYLDRRAGLLDRALDAARRGAQLEPWNAWFRVRIGEILLKMGDREGAIAAARSAADDPAVVVDIDRVGEGCAVEVEGEVVEVVHHAAGPEEGVLRIGFGFGDADDEAEVVHGHQDPAYHWTV